mgnify:CR=1 FL=1
MLQLAWENFPETAPRRKMVRSVKRMHMPKRSEPVAPSALATMKERSGTCKA